MSQESLSNLTLFPVVHKSCKTLIIPSNIMSDFAEMKVKNIFYGKYIIICELLMS